MSQKLTTLLGALLLLSSLGAPREARGEAIKFKIGTLAPKASPWGKVFETWAKAVKEKSGGNLELVIFYNGVQGDEAAMVGKMKNGQLMGAAISGIGLGKVHKPILALQMPGLFTSWAKLDAARSAMKSEFEKGAQDAGFFIAGWGDVGLVRMMSKGFAVKLPSDYTGEKKPLYVRADPLQAAVYSAIGGVSGVSLDVPEVLPNLNTGALNALSAPCLVAEQLQWSSKLDNLTDAVIGVAIGALVISQKYLDGLPADLRAILTDTGKVAANALTTRIRGEDEAACRRLKGKMTTTTLSAQEMAKWEAVFKAARQKLAQGTFTPDLVAKLEGYAK